MSNEGEFESGFSYSAHHIPSNEDWYLLGISKKRNLVCAAGWPPSMGKLSDCEKIEKIKELSEYELNYRKNHFGTDWI